MALKCDICGKRFKRIEDVYTHPYSLLRPKFVHRHCLSTGLAMLTAGAPTIATDLEMAVPSMTLLSVLLIILLSHLPISPIFFILLALFVGIIAFRIHFMRYYAPAVRSFEK